MKPFLGPLETHASRPRVVVIPVPFDDTCSWIKGARYGPRAIIEASAFVELYDLETRSEPYKVGIATDMAIEATSQNQLRKELEGRVTSALGDARFPIILGGEHSVSLGAIAACSRHYLDLSVLQFDAHTDLRESYEGNPYSHACIMKRALGLVRNITSIGIRSMDASEVETAKSVNIFQASELRSDIPLDRIVGTLSPNVYITLDLDVFDPSIMPATGTPEPGGLLWYETLSMLRAVFLKKNVVGCDIVELSPVPGAHAADFLAARLAYKLIAYKYFLKQ